MPIWRWWATQPRSVITRVAPIAAPRAAATVGQLGEAGGVVEAGAAAEDPGRLGEVHRRHVGRQHVDDRRVVPGRGVDLDRGHRRRWRVRSALDAAHARLQRDDDRLVHGHGVQGEAAGPGEADPFGGDGDGAGQQAAAEPMGQAGREVAAVG